MKSFEKFHSRALKSDALKEIKGGATMADNCDQINPDCENIYRSCSWACGDVEGDWWDCVLSYSPPSCSPLQGWDYICYYNC